MQIIKATSKIKVRTAKMEPRYTLTISSVGQITIPRSVRKLLGLEKGARLDLEVNEKKQTFTLKKQPTFDDVMAEIDQINSQYPKVEIDPKYKNMSVGEMSLELTKNLKGDTWV